MEGGKRGSSRGRGGCPLVCVIYLQYILHWGTAKNCNYIFNVHNKILTSVSSYNQNVLIFSVSSAGEHMKFDVHMCVFFNHPVWKKVLIDYMN